MKRERLLELAGIAEDHNWASISKHGPTTSVPSHILDSFEDHVNDLIAAIQLHVPDPVERAKIVADISNVLKTELL